MDGRIFFFFLLVSNNRHRRTVSDRPRSRVAAVRHVLRQQRGAGQVRRAVRGRGALQHRVQGQDFAAGPFGLLRQQRHRSAGLRHK